MGELFIRRITSQDELWLCDDCGQEGLKASGKEINHNGEMVMWFCYNCVERVKRTIERNYEM
jgi:hypothetical protein